MDYGVGRPKGNEDIYIARYERHNREVMEYFKDRSEQLLVLNITAGEGWTKLCPFLNEQIPSISFPCANIASEREKLPWRKNFWYRKFTRQARELLRTATGRATIELRVRWYCRSSLVCFTGLSAWRSLFPFQVS